MKEKEKHEKKHQRHVQRVSFKHISNATTLAILESIKIACVGNFTSLISNNTYTGITGIRAVVMSESVLLFSDA